MSKMNVRCHLQTFRLSDGNNMRIGKHITPVVTRKLEPGSRKHEKPKCKSIY